MYCIYLLICVSTLQRLPNGSIDAHDDGSRVSELQELLDRTNKELAQTREHSATLNARVAELETELANARRELSRSEELSIKQQREQREVRVKEMFFCAGRKHREQLASKTWSFSSKKLRKLNILLFSEKKNIGLYITIS